jgi:hypothetical protein
MEVTSNCSYNYDRYKFGHQLHSVQHFIALSGEPYAGKCTLGDDHSNSRITKWSLACTHVSWSDLIWSDLIWSAFEKEDIRSRSTYTHLLSTTCFISDLLIKMGSAFVSPHLFFKARYTLAVYSSRECRMDMPSGPVSLIDKLVHLKHCICPLTHG